MRPRSAVGCVLVVACLLPASLKAAWGRTRSNGGPPLRRPGLRRDARAASRYAQHPRDAIVHLNAGKAENTGCPYTSTSVGAVTAG